MVKNMSAAEYRSKEYIVLEQLRITMVEILEELKRIADALEYVCCSMVDKIESRVGTEHHKTQEDQSENQPV